METLTKEMLVEAANDLNKVMDLKPAIATEFTSSLEGVALKGVEKKFTDQLGKDLVEVATCSDGEGKLLLQPTDILQPATIDVLEALGVKGIREKVGGTTAKKTPPAKSKSKAGEAPSTTGKKDKAGKADKTTKKTPAPTKTKEEEGKTAKPKAKTGGDKNDWGHRVGSQGAQIDEICKKYLSKGKILEAEALAKEAGLSVARVNMHLKHLRERKLIKE